MPPPSQIPNFSTVSKRLVVAGWVEYGSEEDGHNGQPRSPTEPHGAPIKGNYAPKSNFLSPFSHFCSSRFPFPPPPKRNVSAVSKTWYWFGGWNTGARRRSMWGVGHNGQPRNPTEPHRTPIRGNYAAESNFSSAFYRFCSSRFPFPPSPIHNVPAVSQRLVLVGRLE